MKTTVYQSEAKWGRPAYLKLVDDKVVFDCSDEEYGPIEFDLSDALNGAISLHLQLKINTHATDLPRTPV